MNSFKAWLSLQEKTLYHGTLLDYEPTIRKFGLVGGWHEPDKTFVGWGYDDQEHYGIERSEKDNVIFMADKKTLDKSVNAMVFQIAQKLNKGFHDVNDNDIRNHGLLVVVDDEDDDFKPHNPDDYFSEDPPRGTEPGDYYASEVSGKHFLKGAALIRFLTRKNVFPRDWGDGDEQAREKVWRDKYSRKAIAQNYIPKVALHVAQDAPINYIKDKLK